MGQKKNRGGQQATASTNNVGEAMREAERQKMLNAEAEKHGISKDDFELSMIEAEEKKVPVGDIIAANKRGNALVVMTPAEKAFAALWGGIYGAAYRIGPKCVPPTTAFNRRLSFGPRMMGGRPCYVAGFEVEESGEKVKKFAHALAIVIHHMKPGQAYDCLVWEFEGNYVALPWCVAGKDAILAYNKEVKEEKRLTPDNENPVYVDYEGDLLFVVNVRQPPIKLGEQGHEVRKLAGARFRDIKSIMLRGDSVDPPEGEGIFALEIGEKMESHKGVWAVYKGPFEKGMKLQVRRRDKTGGHKQVEHIQKLPRVLAIEALGVTINRLNRLAIPGLIASLIVKEMKASHPTIKAIEFVGWKMPESDGEKCGLVAATLQEVVRVGAEEELDRYRSEMYVALPGIAFREMALAVVGITEGTEIGAVRKRLNEARFRKPPNDDPVIAWMQANGAPTADNENPTAIEVRKTLVAAAEKILLRPIVEFVASVASQEIRLEAWTMLQPTGNSMEDVQKAVAGLKAADDGGHALAYINKRLEENAMTAFDLAGSGNRVRFGKLLDRTASEIEKALAPPLNKPVAAQPEGEAAAE